MSLSISVCVFMHSPHMSADAFKDQRCLVPLQLELKFVSSLTLVLGVKMGPRESSTALHSHHPKPSPQPPLSQFLSRIKVSSEIR